MTEVPLRHVERGLPGVSMGAYLAVMQVLQLQGDEANWAAEDAQGRHLQDAELQNAKRPRRPGIQAAPGQRLISAAKSERQVQKIAPPTRAVRAPEIVRTRQSEDAAKSISATDLLFAIRLPVIKHSGKKKQ